MEKTLDEQAKIQAAANGMPVQDVTVADPAYPLITGKVQKAILQQCTHILNGCLQAQGTQYVQIGMVNYSNTGVQIPEYQYLCSTSQVESLHSVSQRHFNAFNQIRSELFDAKALWMIINYNRGQYQRNGKPAPPRAVAPSEVTGACLAPTADGILFGFDYARKVISDLETGITNTVHLGGHFVLEPNVEL
jgi:hypothetical protein